ncbi:hypothetical protein EYZ11_004651 [Aspergillus tanneri]|uniref:Uncharacterized protein n=1 Tax=Aspergillus tanneri TaxID=1220188 RepID=A0A4S3JK81_9EURO|nr:hypothetical protein EYZ11_004651 [Aspergillus tanneri]
MVHPDDLVAGRWDIGYLNLAEAADHAAVLESVLKDHIPKELATIKPLPSIYYPDFVAANQGAPSHGLNMVLVLWKANTEPYAEIIPCVNQTPDELLWSIQNGHTETKKKAGTAEFLINVGIRVKLIASYNHLGNYDGYNPSAPNPTVPF